MMLARADQSAERYYSMSSQIESERNDYYEALTHTATELGHHPMDELVHRMSRPRH